MDIRKRHAVSQQIQMESAKVERQLYDRYVQEKEREIKQLLDYVEKESVRRQEQEKQRQQQVEKAFPNLNTTIPTAVDYLKDTPKWFTTFDGETGKSKSYVQSDNQIDVARQNLSNKLERLGPASLTDEEKTYYLQADPKYQLAMAKRYLPEETEEEDNDSKDLTARIFDVFRNTIGQYGRGLGNPGASTQQAILDAARLQQLGKEGKLATQNDKDEYVKDVVSTWNIGKNQAEIEAYLDSNVRLGEKKQYVDAIKIYSDNLSKYVDLYREYNLLLASGDKGNDAKLKQQSLLEEMGNLLRWNTGMQKLIEEGSTYDLSVGTGYNNVQYTSQQRLNKLVEAQYGTDKVTPRSMADVAKELLAVTAEGGFVPGKAISLNIIDKITQLSSEANSRFQDYNVYSEDTIKKNDAMARQNMRELAEWKRWHTPSKAFKAREEAAQDNYLTNLDTYTHGMWGTLGSSAAFNGIQLMSTGLDYLGAGLLYSPHPYAKVAGVAATAAGAALGIVSGDRENRAEITSNYIEGLTESLQREEKYDKFIKDGKELLEKKGITVDEDRDVFLHFLLKDYIVDDPVIQDLALRHMFGANNAYQNDMIAVTADVALNAGLNIFGPAGTVAKTMKLTPLGKFARLRRFVNAADKLPVGSEFVKNVARAGHGTGMAISSAMSPLAGGIYKVAAGAVKPVLKKVAKWLEPLIETAEKRVATALGFTKVAPNHLFKIGTGAKYTFDFAGRTITRGFSEAIEEGKQYEYGEKFQNGEFAGRSNTILDTLMDDLSTGTLAGLTFIGSQLFGLQADKALMQNMRGGFLGGILNHGTLISAVQDATGTVREMKAGEAIYDIVTMQKMLDRSELLNGEEYAKFTSAAGYRAMQDAIDRYSNIMNSIGSGAISDEQIDKIRQEYLRIYNYANSKDVIDAAEKRNIKPGTKKFRSFVSLLSHIDRKYNDKVQDYNEAVSRAESLVGNDVLSNEALTNLEEYLETGKFTEQEKEELRKLSASIEGELTEEEQKLIPTFNSNREAARKKNKDKVANAMRKIRAQRARREAQRLRGEIGMIRATDSGIAKAAALKRLISELGEREEYLTDAEKYYLSAYKQQYDTFINSLHPLLAANVESAVEDLSTIHEVTDPELYDNLSSVYRTLAQYEAELQELMDTRIALTGTRKLTKAEIQSRERILGRELTEEEKYASAVTSPIESETLNDFVNWQMRSIYSRLYNNKKHVKRWKDGPLEAYIDSVKGDQEFMEEINRDFREFNEQLDASSPTQTIYDETGTPIEVPKNERFVEEPEARTEDGWNWETAKMASNAYKLPKALPYNPNADAYQAAVTGDYSQIFNPNSTAITLPQQQSSEFSGEEPPQEESAKKPITVGQRVYATDPKLKKDWIVSDVKRTTMLIGNDVVSEVLIGLRNDASDNTIYMSLDKFNQKFTNDAHVLQNARTGEYKVRGTTARIGDRYTSDNPEYNKNWVIVDSRAKDGKIEVGLRHSRSKKTKYIPLDVFKSEFYPTPKNKYIRPQISILRGLNFSQKLPYIAPSTTIRPQEDPEVLLDPLTERFYEYIETLQNTNGVLVIGDINDPSTQMGALYTMFKYDIHNYETLSATETSSSYFSNYGRIITRINSIVEDPYQLNGSLKRIQRVVSVLLASAKTKEEYDNLLRKLQDYYNGELDESVEENKKLLELLPPLKAAIPTIKLHPNRLDLTMYIESGERADADIIDALIQEGWLSHGNASIILRQLAKDVITTPRVLPRYEEWRYSVSDQEQDVPVSTVMLKESFDNFVIQVSNFAQYLRNQGKIVDVMDAPIVYNDVATDIDFYTVDKNGCVEFYNIASSKHNLNERWDKIEAEDRAPVFDDRFVPSSRFDRAKWYVDRKETRRMTYNKLATSAITAMENLLGTQFHGINILPIKMDVSYDANRQDDVWQITETELLKTIPLRKSNAFDSYLHELLTKEQIEEKLNEAGGFYSTIQQIREKMDLLEERATNEDVSELVKYVLDTYLRDAANFATVGIDQIDLSAVDGKMTMRTIDVITRQLLNILNEVNIMLDRAELEIQEAQYNNEDPAEVARISEITVGLNNVQEWIDAVEQGQYTLPGGFIEELANDAISWLRINGNGLRNDLRRMRNSNAKDVLDRIDSLYTRALRILQQYPNVIKPQVRQSVSVNQPIISHNEPMFPHNHPLSIKSTSGRYITNQKDFVTRGTCLLIHGKLDGKTGIVTPINQPSTAKDVGVYAIFSYNGVQYTPVLIQPSHYKNSIALSPMGVSFVNDVIAAQIEAERTGNTVSAEFGRLLPTIYYNGAPQNLINNNVTSLSMDYIRELNGYSHDIALVNKNGQLVPLKSSGIPVVLGNVEESSPGEIYFLKRFEFDEYTHGGMTEFPYRPMKLIPKKLAEGDKQVILDILEQNAKSLKTLKYSSLYQPYIKDGRPMPFTGMQLLSLYVNVKPGDAQLLRVLPDGNVMYRKNVREKWSSPKDITSAFDRKEIVERFLNGAELNVDRTILSERLTDKQSDTFKNLQQWFLTEEILSISESLIFDKEDLQDGGLFGIGWAIRHGRLQTNASSINSSSLYVNLPQTQVSEEPSSVSEEPYNPNEDILNNVTGIDTEGLTSALDDVFGGMFSTDYADDPSKRIDVNEAKARLNRILGESADVKVVNNILKVLDGGAKAVGACTADAITLSTYAASGVEYHEAFHRIFELVIDPKDRLKYQNIFLNKHKNIDSSDSRAVAEAMADEFMDLMRAKDDFKSSVLRKPFRAIWNFIKAVIKVGSFRMLKLYFDMNSGKYADVVVSNASKTRFNTEFSTDVDGVGILYYDVYNPSLGEEVSLPNIPNAVVYKDVIDSIANAIISENGIAFFGDGLHEIDLSIEGIQKMGNGVFYNQAIGQDDKVSYVNAMFRDVFTNWEYVLPDVAAALRSKGLPVKVRKDKKALEVSLTELNEEIKNLNEDKEGGETGSTADIGQYTKDSYEMARHVSVKNAARYFFSTIPKIHYVEEGETDDNGNPIPTQTYIRRGKYFVDLRNRPVEKRGDKFFVANSNEEVPKIALKLRRNFLTDYNSIGYTQYVPYRDAFSLIVNACYDVKSPAELLKRLGMLALEDASFLSAWQQYKKAIENIDNIDSNGLYTGLYDKQKYVKGTDGYYRKAKYDRLTGVVTIYDEETFTRGELILAPNYNWQSIVVSVFNAVASAKNTFKMIRSMSNPGAAPSYQIVDTDMGYSARKYSLAWASRFLNDSNIIRKEIAGLTYRYSLTDSKYLDKIADEFDILLKAYTNLSTKEARTGEFNTTERIKYNIYTDNEKIKNHIVRLFNMLGIDIDKKHFDILLANIANGRTDTQAVAAYFRQNGEDVGFAKGVSLYKFILSIRSAHKNGVLSNMAVSGAFFTKSGVISQLADAKYKYNHRNVLNMVHAPGDNLYYDISQKTILQMMCDELNSPTSKMIQDLLKSSYSAGSIFLHRLQSGKYDIVFENHVGYRSDSRSDRGSDYMQLSSAEDFISKMVYLQNDEFPFLTMSNKKTYGCIFLRDRITGQHYRIPGIRFRENTETNVRSDGSTPIPFAVEEETLPVLTDATYNSKLLVTGDKNQNKYFILPESIYSTLMYYARSEREAVVQGIERMRTVPDSQKVVNYDTATCGAKIPGCARFSRLYGIYVPDEKGKEKFVTFCDQSKTPEENLSTADTYFFKADGLTQRAIITNLVQKELDRTIDRAVELGLVERVNDGYFGIKNIALDKDRIDAIVKSIYPRYGTFQITDRLGNTKTVKRTANAVKSLATTMLLLDTTIRSIIAGEELHRMFIGNPGQFKVFYDGNNVTDDTGDLSKRLGGHVSTGETNCPIEGYGENYKCAEIKDLKKKSPHYDQLKEWFTKSESRNSLYDDYKKEIYSEYESEKYSLIQYALGIGKTLFEGKDYAKYTPTSKWFTEDNLSEMMFAIEKIAKASMNNFGSFDFSYYTNAVQAYIHDEMSKYSDDACTKEYIRQNAEDFTLDKVNQELIDRKLKEGVDARIEGLLNSFEDNKVNVADGASYISPYMVKRQLQSIGLFNGKVARAWNLLMSDDVQKSLDVADSYKTIMDAMFGTQKYTATGYRINNGQPVFYYNKTALFPMFKQCCHGLIRDIYDIMDRQGIDMLMFESAVKFGSQGAQHVPTTTEELKNFKFNTYMQPFKFLVKQLNTDPDESDSQAIGTQAAKVAMAVCDRTKTDYKISASTTFSRTEPEVISGKDLINDMFDNMNKSCRKHVRSFFEQFEKDGEYDEKLFSDYLLGKLTERDANVNMLTGLRMKEGLMRAKTLSALSNTNWVQSIVASDINRNIIDINLPGSAFIQRSVYGMEEGSVLFDNETRRLNGGKKLLMKNSDGSMDAVISIDYFYQQFPNLKKMSFNKAREWLIKKGLVGENAKTLTMAYRIPTQAVSSIHALKFVDVIAATRDTIILPEEFTAVTGSDFDIDKLFLTTKWLKNENGQITDVYDEDSAEYYENKLLDDYLNLLMQPENKYASILLKTVDNATSVLQDVAEETTPQNKKLVGVYESIGLAKQSKIKDQNKSGSKGIGPFALNNNSAVLSEIFKVGFTPTGIIKALGMTRLYDAIDREGRKSRDAIEAGINGNVDIAKGAWVSDINMGDYTYDIGILLMRTGFGKHAAYFMKQPIIRELMLADEKARGFLFNKNDQSYYQLRKDFFTDIERSHFFGGRTQSVSTAAGRLLNLIRSSNIISSTNLEKEPTIEYDKHNQILKEKSSDNLYAYDTLEIILQIFGVDPSNPNKQLGYCLDQDGNKIKGYSSILLYTAINFNKPEDIDVQNKLFTVTVTDYDQNEKKFVKKLLKLSPNDVQMYVYIANVMLEPFVKAMQDMVQYSKIDTKKQGKTIAEQWVYYNKYLETFIQNIFGIFDQNITDMATKSFIDTKTRLSYNAFINVLNLYFIDATDYALHMYLPTAMRYGFTKNADTVSALLNALQSYVKYSFIYTYADKNGIKIKDLFVGDNSMYNKLGYIRQQIKSQPKLFAEYIDQTGNINNALLNSLEEVFLRPQDAKNWYPKFLEIPSNREIVSSTTDQIITAWEYMLNDINHPDILKFAQELIVYSFITSGDVSGGGTFFEYVPESWREDSGYANYIEEAIEFFNSEAALESPDCIADHMFALGNNSPSSFEGVLIDILKNNWYDNNLVPTILRTRRNAFNEQINNIIEYTSKDGQSYYVAAIENKTDPATGQRMLLEPSRFSKNLVVKIKKFDANSDNSLEDYDIFELAGFGQAVNSLGNLVRFPIYKKTFARGGMFYGNKMIQYQENLGYSWENNEDLPIPVNFVEDLFNDATLQKLEVGESILKSRQQDLKELMVSREEVLKDAFNKMMETDLDAVINGTPSKISRIGDTALIATYIALDKIANPNRKDTYVLKNETGAIKSLPFVKKQKEESDIIDIKFGQGLFGDLSNFAVRPFSLTEDAIAQLNNISDGLGDRINNMLDAREESKFDSVEQAFHYTKLDLLKKQVKDFGLRQQISANQKAILNASTDKAVHGRAVKQIGGRRYYDPTGTVERFFSETWPNIAMQIESILMESSFMTNGKAASLLRSTGTRPLSHTIGRDGHETNVPQTLERIRTNLPEIDTFNGEGNDSGQFATQGEQEKTLNSDLTILSNEELKQWNKDGILGNPRILVASEHTDPAFHVQELLDIIEGRKSVEQKPKFVKISKDEYDALPNDQRWYKQATKQYFRKEQMPPLTGKDFNGLYIITKHDGLPMKQLLATKIPKLIHFSITSLGGSQWEPGVMKHDDLLDRILEYIQSGLDPNTITIRIDPIIPGVSKKEDIEHIIKRASDMGIKRIRFSVMDVYKGMIPFMEQKGYDFSMFYDIAEVNLLRLNGKTSTGKNHLNANKAALDFIADMFVKYKELYGIEVGTCAEPLVRPGISQEGCLSVAAVNNMLGTSIADRGTYNNNSRQLCSCYGGKTDALAYGSHCASMCTYCYAHQQKSAAMRYYNEDGTLIQNQWTTGVSPSAATSSQAFDAIKDVSRQQLSAEEQLKKDGNDRIKDCGV